MSFTLSILVWSGPAKKDFKKTRHAGLFFQLDTVYAPRGVLVHATSINNVPRFVVVKESYDPKKSITLAGQSSVGHFTTVSMDAMASEVEGTPVKNDDEEWNCQNWVGEALERLVARGWLTAQTRSDALGDTCHDG
ncbi:hypothetical protein PRK78_005772 [Emydomyces testavorans]|uniref:Uncharacterized protein n=1 Tax=Emydomyces testavorans TaxID=2070801 RepID=A0AAF0DKE6_9EURO|nr:hypothetical protein PRK78_005772 [Emydomyces testavorans]